jgi:ubiquinone/menaquinone biosynthesis C-methylase UbiE
MTRDEIEQGVNRLSPWFYPFAFAHGVRTASYLPSDVQPIFETRREMLHRTVEAHFGDRLGGIDCLDVGCHEGFYGTGLAPRVRRVVGLDYRAESVERARFVADALGLVNCEFRQGDVEELHPARDGVYPLTLFLGVLYHLESPMRALRRLAMVTGELCVIETQVMDEVSGATEWGSSQWSQPYRGVLALIDETDAFDSANRETGSTPLATCPSPAALVTMLRHAGFSRVAFIAPPPDAYEQHARGKRVVCAAYR